MSVVISSDGKINLNEVLNIRAQECGVSSIGICLTSNLNEVLNIRAQEFVRHCRQGAWQPTSMKS